MNEKDIYSLIGESFDDKIKLNFDDVKNRIAKLEDKESAVITPLTPSKNRKKAVFAVVAAAACLVCVIGLSAVLSSMGNFAKSEADAGSYVMYDSIASYEAVYEDHAAESPECFDAEVMEESVPEDSSDDILNALMGSSYGAEMSDSDLSGSDTVSDSDLN